MTVVHASRAFVSTWLMCLAALSVDHATASTPNRAPQSSAAPAQVDTVAQLAAAERDLDAERIEDALLHLWVAQRGLRELPEGAIRDAAEAALARLMPRADPLLDVHTKLDRETGKPLLALARSYRTKKWMETYEAVARLAADFDPVNAAKDLRWNAASAPTSAEPTRATLAFDALRVSTSNGQWTASADSLATPEELGADGAWYVTDVEHRDHAIQVEVGVGVVKGPGNCMVGLIVGGVDALAYHIVDLVVWPELGVVSTRFFRWGDGAVTLIGTADCSPGLRPDQPLRMEVRVRGEKVSVFLNGVDALEAAAEDALRGKVGFYVSASSEYKGALQLTNFKVGPLPVEAEPTDVDVLDQDRQRERRISLTMAEAARQLELAQPESAASCLRSARVEALSLGTETLRSALLAAIDQSLAKADPLHARRAKAFAAAAESQRELAEAYAERGLLRAAAAVAATMESLDPDGQGVRAAEFRRRAALSDVDAGGSGDGGGG